ncbi:unnamed protein product [Closterium sp. NIES-53]
MFICKQDGGSWSAKQYAAKEEDNKDLTADGADLYALGRKLVSLAIENSSGGGVTSFFSYTTPNAGVYEVNSSLRVISSGNCYRKGLRAMLPRLPSSHTPPNGIAICLQV